MSSFVSADVFINEFLPNSANTDHEWIELFNNGTVSVSLNDFNISEEGTNKNFTIGDITIDSNGFVVLVRDFTTFNQTYNLSGVTLVEYGSVVPLLNLNDGGDSVFLYNASGDLIDSILKYANPGENVSIGRHLDGTSNIINLTVQTPGDNNDNAAPVFNKWVRPSTNNSVIGGLFNVTVNITDATHTVNVSLIDFNNSNFTMSQDNDLFYYLWNTSLNTDGAYNITIYFNDSVGLSNTDILFNVTVDNTKPNILAPQTSANSRNYVNPGFNFNASVNATDTNLLNVTCTLGSTTVANFSNDGNAYHCNLTSALVAATASNPEQDFEITFTAIDTVGNTNTTTINFTTKHSTSASLAPNDITITDLNNSDKIVNIDATLTNTGANIMFEPGVRLTGLSSTFPGSILTDYAACNEANLTAGQSCTVPLNITVKGANNGTFSAFWNANWTNSNFSEQSLAQSKLSTITISDNPIISITSNITTTINHRASKNITLHVNSTGNVDLSNVVVTYVPTNLTSSQVSFISSSNLATVSSDNSTVNITVSVPTATSPGTYIGKLSVTADSTTTKETDLIVDVPQDTTWTATPNNVSVFRKITDSGTAATITINNSGNVDMDFSISYSGNMFEFLMLPPVTVVNSLSVSKNSANSFNIDHNANGPLTEYDLTVTLVNDLTSEVNVSVIKLTQDDNNPNVNITNPINNSFVKGIVEFNVSASDLNLSNIEFYINDSLVFNDREINKSFKWNTANGSYPDDIYTLKAIAFDSAGNSNSSNINVTVNNTDDDPILISNIPTINIIEDNDSTILNLSLFFDTLDGETFDGNDFQYNFTQPDNVTVHINNATEIANFTPDANFNGLNYITFTAIDSSLNTTSSNNVTISVTNVNDAPTTPNLISPEDGSNVTSSEGKATLRWDTSIDVENDPITYYVFVSNDNSDIRFNKTTSDTNLPLTNLDSSTTYFWNVLANDSLLNSSKSTTFNFTIIRDNDPVINLWNWSNTLTNSTTDTSPTVAENKTLNFTIIASDPDNDPINFTWFIDNEETSNVQNFSFDLTENFTAAGNYVIKLQVQDNNSNSAEQEWQVTVTNTNREPVLNFIGNIEAIEDLILKFNITASDPDEDILTYTSNQTGLSITKFNNTVATVLWTPTNDNVGDNIVTFTVNDSSKTDSETILIDVGNINDAPTITSFFPTDNKTIAVVVGSQKFNITFVDVDVGDTNTAVWYKNGTQITTSNPETVTVTNLIEGIYNITVITQDSSGEGERKEWTLTVTTNIIGDGLTSPILSLNETKRQNATDVVIEQATFGEIDFGNETLNFSGVINLEDAFNISRGLISVDTETYPGLNRNASIVMKGLDFTKAPLINTSSGFEDTAGGVLCPEDVCTSITYDVANGILRFNVTHFSTYSLETNTTNGAPVITSTPITTAIERAEYTYDVSATDPDGDVLTFSLIESPTGMSISSSSGLITWTPTLIQVGLNNVTVNVSDVSLNETQSFNITVTEGPKLQIKDLDVKVDGKTDKNLKDGDKISKEAKPGSKVIFDIEIENLFTKEEDLEIEDIEVEITIEDIDDGDDLDEDTKEFDIKPEKDKNIKIDFNIPWDVEEDIFDVIITIEGKDENNTNHEITFNLELEVEKENHEIMIIRSLLSPKTISCQRQISLNTEIVNTGADDEEDVTLEIVSSGLGISSLTDGIELDEGTDDNRFSKLVTSSVSNDVLPGTYPITINTYYDGKLSETETVNLDVQECELVKKIKKEVKEKKPEVVVLRPEAKKVEKPEAEVSFAETEGYNVLIAILIVIFLGTAIFVIGAGFILLRK